MKGIKLIAAAAALVSAFAGRAEADHLTASVTIEDASRSQDRVVITVTGTYSCDGIVEDNPDGDFAGINVDVAQAAGQSINRGFGGSRALCDGTLQTFEI